LRFRGWNSRVPVSCSTRGTVMWRMTHAIRRHGWEVAIWISSGAFLCVVFGRGCAKSLVWDVNEHSLAQLRARSAVISVSILLTYTGGSKILCPVKKTTPLCRGNEWHPAVSARAGWFSLLGSSDICQGDVVYPKKHQKTVVVIGIMTIKHWMNDDVGVPHFQTTPPHV
jgi:hypothetical protein